MRQGRGQKIAKYFVKRSRRLKEKTKQIDVTQHKMAAFRIVSDSDASMLMKPPVVSAAMCSFLSVPDPEFLAPMPMDSINGIKRNLQSEWSRLENSNSTLDEESLVVLPIPSPKETVRVYLRVKPKTEEESHYYRYVSISMKTVQCPLNDSSKPGSRFFLIFC